MPHPANPEPASALLNRVRQAIASHGGWLPFDRYMAMALYEPGLGYYSGPRRVLGHWPADGSDFVTAPEISPLFGQTLARQVAQALQAAQASTVLELGAGTGALAEQLLQALGPAIGSYQILDLSGSLRERQAARLAAFGEQVQWLDRLPAEIHGVVLGNEVLDAMPVQLLHWDGRAWLERGVALAPGEAPGLCWADRPTPLRPPCEPAGLVPGTVVEIHPQAEAFVRSLAGHLVRGAAFFIDYGFPEAEYYHPQRQGGTLMCHHAHRADADPLQNPGEKDITSHVNFTAIALAAQASGLEVLGYTSQARFLINCGLAELLQAADLPGRARAQKLITEHEMGELFKVIGLARGIALDAIGFSAGDRSHRL